MRQAFFVNETNHHAMVAEDPQVGTVNVEYGAMDLGPRKTNGDEVVDSKVVAKHSLTKTLAESTTNCTACASTKKEETTKPRTSFPSPRTTMGRCTLGRFPGMGLRTCWSKAARVYGEGRH